MILGSVLPHFPLNRSETVDMRKLSYIIVIKNIGILVRRLSVLLMTYRNYIISYLHAIFLESFQDENGKVTELTVKAVKLTYENRPKAYIHWVANPTHCQVRIYERL